jgi:hypothetical protein
MSRSYRVLFIFCLISLAACLEQRPGGDDDDAADGVDTDGDGVPDSQDACPEDPEQSADADEDGICDEVDDACPSLAGQSTDADGDGVCDEEDDACPEDATGWTDLDGDGVCDEVADACPEDPNQWTDADGDGVCDEVDDACPGDGNSWTDADGDGVCDEVDDDCPDNSEGWVDSNSDGVCDGEDDTDGDGISDAEESIYGEDCAISDRLEADTDGDGTSDNQDMYPRDPYPEYILFRNDQGTIDLVLSNRDGTFEAPEAIGMPFGGDPSQTHYRYTHFVVSDFDNNGTTDFLAIGDRNAGASASGPVPVNPTLDLWWFGRVAGPTAFSQRLIDSTLTRNFLSSLADVDNDERVDLVSGESTKNAGGNLATLRLVSYLNQGTIAAADCAWTTDPTNPDGCAFVQVPGIDLTTWVVNSWVWRMSKDAVDVDGDGNRDFAIVKHRSGGNSTIAVTLVHGNGDGSFTLPNTAMFQHNDNRTQSPVNSIVFNDFDNDGLGDVIIGLDDDGDAGSAWFYPGRYSASSGFEFSTAGSFEAFDVNPGDESGGENAGFSTSARSFDFDFDGNQDIILGYNYNRPWDPPSHTVLMEGLGTGSFGTMSVIRDFPDVNATVSYGQSFSIPQRLCQRFSIVL